MYQQPRKHPKQHYCEYFFFQIKNPGHGVCRCSETWLITNHLPCFISAYVKPYISQTWQVSDEHPCFYNPQRVILVGQPVRGTCVEEEKKPMTYSKYFCFNEYELRKTGAKPQDQKQKGCENSLWSQEGCRSQECSPPPQGPGTHPYWEGYFHKQLKGKRNAILKGSNKNTVRKCNKIDGIRREMEERNRRVLKINPSLG